MALRTVQGDRRDAFVYFVQNSFVCHCFHVLHVSLDTHRHWFGSTAATALAAPLRHLSSGTTATGSQFKSALSPPFPATRDFIKLYHLKPVTIGISIIYDNRIVTRHSCPPGYGGSDRAKISKQHFGKNFPLKHTPNDTFMDKSISNVKFPTRYQLRHSG